MGKIVEKKKKKGRPSLLDIQKRTLREQQQQQYQNQNQTNPNLNSNNSVSPNHHNRRFARQNLPNSDTISTGEEEDDLDQEDNSTKKKFKVVVKLKNSQALSNCDDEISIKKRKINEVGGGSVIGDIEKEEKLNTASRASDSGGMEIESSGPTTPLPDKKLLVFILDRLQKKDTYGVYSEPVDPKELPDYHEYVDHPMDFGTVRKKLASGAYANLEQFENDVFLISSNAMKYNAPDTIYYRQARSIQELARKDFENLRQESDDNQSQPKVARRGRPPTKHLKKRLGRPPIDRLSSEFSSNATLANGGDNNNYDLRRGPFPGKYSSADVSGWSYHGSEANDDYSGLSMKYGKKNIVLEENRRNTYKQSHQLSSERSTSVLTTFDGEKKQLMAVGLHMEHGFARSLARFAATLGPVAWKIASKKIERALPSGVKFGPGWVGECEAPSSLLSLPIRGPAHIWPQQPFSLPKPSSVTCTGSTLDVETDELQVRQGSLNNSASDVQFNNPNFQSTKVSSPSLVGDISHDCTIEQREPTAGPSNEAALHPNRPFQIHQGSAHRPSMNGLIGGFHNPASLMDKPVRPVLLVGDTTSTTSGLSEIKVRDVRTSNNFVPPPCYNGVESEDAKLPMTTINSDAASLGHPIAEAQGRTSGSPLQESDTVPPDLNVRFQSSGSPNSTQ